VTFVTQELPTRPTIQPSKFPMNHHNDFEDYVSRLPTWEQKLLNGVLFTTGPYSMMLQIQSTPINTIQFLEVSDG
jgi:hypothetical protein